VVHGLCSLNFDGFRRTYGSAPRGSSGELPQAAVDEAESQDRELLEFYIERVTLAVCGRDER